MLAVSLVVGVVAGCSSSSADAPASTPAVAAAAATATPSPTVPASPTVPPAELGGVPVDDVCAFIASDLPRLADQAKVGTLARLSADLTDFYAAQGRARPDGAPLDQALQKTCPEIRAAALVATGQPDLRPL
jgi:hypothetical protein